MIGLALREEYGFSILVLGMYRTTYESMRLRTSEVRNFMTGKRRKKHVGCLKERKKEKEERENETENVNLNLNLNFELELEL